jgi:hypothetical protein
VKDRKKVTKQYVETFIKEQILTSEGSEIFQSIPLEQLIDYFGRIVVPKLMPIACSDYFCKRSVDALFLCIYKFNKRNSVKLYSSDIMNRIFKFFLESKSFEEMLETDDNMCKTKAL